MWDLYKASPELYSCAELSYFLGIYFLGITHGAMAFMVYLLLVPDVIDNFRTNPMKNWHKAEIAEFNSDEALEILWRNSNGYSALWYMAKDGMAIKGTSIMPY